MRALNGPAGVNGSSGAHQRRPARPLQHQFARHRVVEWTTACPEIQVVEVDFGRRKMTG
jgi:hypothetical protein